MRELAKRFVPVADEVTRLQTGRGPDCDWFRTMAEQGHYGGREGRTRQGIYMVAPNGQLLASLNHRSPDRVVRTLNAALEKWDTFDAEARRFTENDELKITDFTEKTRRLEAWFPEGGLHLRVHSRDLPRGDASTRQGYDRWKDRAHNEDNAWFRREEARRFLPPNGGRVGETHKVPTELAERLARLSLVDNVRGQTRPFAPKHIQSLELVAEVIARGGSTVRIELRGSVHLAEAGRWRQGRGEEEPARRGYRGNLFGFGEYDLVAERFTEFTLVSIGTRYGGTRYNARGDDLDPAPVGYLFAQMDPADPVARVAPASIWRYRWKPPW